jgi:hypothetical protein
LPEQQQVDPDLVDNMARGFFTGMNPWMVVLIIVGLIACLPDGLKFICLILETIAVLLLTGGLVLWTL